MTFTSLLIHTCNIGTATSSQNSLGEWTHSWTYSSTDTSCRMIPVNHEERSQLPGDWDNVTYRAYFASGTSVTTQNRIKYQSQYYLVRQAYQDSSHHHEVAYIARL